MVHLHNLHVQPIDQLNFLFHTYTQGYTTPDSAQSTEPNSLASIDQPDSSLRTATGKHSNNHLPTHSSNNNNNHSSNASNNHSSSISIGGGGGSSSNTIATTTTSNNSNNNNNLRYANAIPAINTMSSKTSSKSTNSSSGDGGIVGNNPHHYSSLTNHSTASSYETTVRKSPEGKDNDSYHREDAKGRHMSNNNLTKHFHNGQLPTAGGSGSSGSNSSTGSATTEHPKIGNDISTEIFSASNDNGKINVQVTVLVGELTNCVLLFAFLLFVLLSFVPYGHSVAVTIQSVVVSHSVLRIQIESIHLDAQTEVARPTDEYPALLNLSKFRQFVSKVVICRCLLCIVALGCSFCTHTTFVSLYFIES